MTYVDSESYIADVMSFLPGDLEDRDDIEMEIRGIIEDRLAEGEPLDSILDQLGDPETLAESYLEETPMERASFFPRLMARAIDTLLITGPLILLPILALPLLREVEPALGLVPMLAAVAGLVLSIPILLLYHALSEWRWGRTLGKRVMGLRVVQESGARITFGQSVLRQLPVLVQFIWVDLIFALFTEKHQRAFEKLSHTRTIEAH